MAQSNMQIKQQRLDALFEECHQHVFSQIIGPFGLSPAMFSDKAGGNVTTIQNFKKGILANENDQALHASLTQEYDRSRFELSQSQWKKKRDERIARGVDEYTNEPLSDRPELDHFIPIKETATDAKMHLARKRGWRTPEQSCKDEPLGTQRTEKLYRSAVRKRGCD